MTTKANKSQLPVSEQDPIQDLQKWFNKASHSVGSLRLLLCGDLTVVQGAVICSWALVAWILGLQTKDLHQLAVYGGIFCVQYLMVNVLGLIHVFIDQWNQLQMDQKSFNLAKRPLDLVVNVIGRLIIWSSLIGVAIFSGFHLRVIPMHSIINCVISACSFANFILLLHCSGAILTDCDQFVQFPNDKLETPSRGIIVRTSISVWSVVMKVLLIGCHGAQMAAHVWPLADTMLVSCLVALGVYMSRRSLDGAWNSSLDVQHARNVAQDSRHLIWPVVILLINYIYDVIFTFFRLTREYALKFLVSVSTEENITSNRQLSNNDVQQQEKKEKLL